MQPRVLRRLLSHAASSAAMAAAKDVTASFQEGMAEGEAGLTDKGDNAKKAEGSEVPPEKKDAA